MEKKGFYSTKPDPTFTLTRQIQTRKTLINQILLQSLRKFKNMLDLKRVVSKEKMFDNFYRITVFF